MQGAASEMTEGLGVQPPCRRRLLAGDERNKMLQRVYATAFAKQSDLQAHLTRLEEARSDHRRLAGSDL